MANVNEIQSFLDTLYNLAIVNDYSNNGLQVTKSNPGVKKIGFGVDASALLFEQARDANCDMVIVHHGLFWNRVLMVDGIHHNRLKLLLENDIALYACHLPMDMHQECGHNALITKALTGNACADIEWFKRDDDKFGAICAVSDVSMSRQELQEKLTDLFGSDPTLLAFGPDQIKRIGVVSGGGADYISIATKAGFDTFITGETKHSAYHVAKELGVNVFFCGHYATEKIALLELMKILKDKFYVECELFDIPTNL